MTDEKDLPCSLNLKDDFCSSCKSDYRIAISWHIDDVRHVRPDLSEKQAKEVLGYIKQATERLSQRQGRAYS